MTRNARTKLSLAALLLASGSTAVFAADMPAKAPEPAAPASNCTNPAPSIQPSLGQYGDPGGIRAYLDSKGICYNFTYIGETLGNVSGGVKRGATYEGRLDINVDADLDKLAGLKDLAFHAEVFQIHGRGLSGNNINDLFTVSGIEAYPDTKLYELWLEQKFGDGKIFVRAGQLAADTEFYLSSGASLFVNSTFGWPAIYANDLPNGGPAYPIATPGLRIKYQPNDQWTLLAAIFNGDPAGPQLPGQSPLAQQRDLGGVDFRFRDPPLIIGEAQYAYNQGKDAKGLPGTVKVGYLHHFEPFPDFNLPTLGNPNVLRGNDSAYAIIDQAVYRVPGTEDQGLSVFGRVSGAPSDRNLIDFYIDGGATYKGLIPGREGDTAGISFAFANVSSNVSTGQLITGQAPLIQDYQAAIEATYQIAVVDGFSIQPDFQYIFHPGAHGVADFDGQPIRDAAIFGLRASLHY